MRRFLWLLLFTLFIQGSVHGQQLLSDMMDTTSHFNKGFLSLYEKYNWLRFSGYLQPQFQYAASKGAHSFNGGDFPANADNRFTLRRGRFRMDYLRLDNDNYPAAHLVFQFDGSEKGFAIRDFWGRVFENKWHLFSLTAGMFARPFGYEVNLGSGDRESPERGRMSQLLMRAERDLGAMLTLEPRKRGNKWSWLRADIAVMNGQGLSGTVDYDSHKDVVARVYSKAQHLNRHGWTLSGGVSVYEGGIISQSPMLYRSEGRGNEARMQLDSAADNIGALAPRRYYGADVQFKIPNKKGFTELRAEYIRGQQTGTATSTESPGVYPMNGLLPGDLYTRSFDGAYFYFLQHLGSEHHQLVLKYDWYDPNTRVKGKEVSAAHGFNGADVKFQTIGLGYIWYINSNVKTVLFYEHVLNEKTTVVSYTEDQKDDVFTCRLQFRF